MSQETSIIPHKIGIILLTLSDPLSQIINRILGLAISDINAVGFYYRDSFKKDRYLVTVFNIYDNHYVPIIPVHTNINVLLDSSQVQKIILYPLRDDLNSSVQDTFQNLVLQTITYNGQALYDKNRSYTNILLRMVNICESESIPTGYTLVNQVLRKMSKNKNMEISDRELCQNGFLERPFVLLCKDHPVPQNDNVDRYRQQIIRLVAIFSDLFISHDLFRTAILNKTLDPVSKVDLQPLLDKEMQLLNILVGGLTSGIISNTDLNDMIHQLGVERFNLGNYQSIPMSMDPVNTVQITKENVPCSFQLPLTLHDINPLRDLGTAISEIAEGFTKTEPLTINIAALVGMYNLAIQGSDLPQVVIPHIGGTHTLSRQAVVTVPGKSSSGNLELNISSHILPIPMFEANLSLFSDLQLKDFLVYIQSLRDVETTETRYINLQNEITHELARRQRLH